MPEQVARVLVDLVAVDIMVVVQETLHQHLHHKEILEVLEEVDTMVVEVVVLDLKENLVL